MSYHDEVLATAPDISWELDDTTATAVDSSGNGRDGTFNYGGTTDTYPNVIQGLPPVVGDGGTSIMLGSGVDAAILYRDDNTDMNVAGQASKSQTYQISVDLSTDPPVVNPTTSVLDDTAALMARAGMFSMTYSYSGTPYINAGYGENNQQIMICSMYTAGYTSQAIIGAHVDAGPHLLTVVLDETDTSVTLFVDGEITPTYVDIPLIGDLPNPTYLPALTSEGVTGGSIAIGGGYGGFGAKFDSFHYWNRALSDSELAALHSSWSTGAPEAEGPISIGTGVSNAKGAVLQVSEETFVFAPEENLASSRSSATATITAVAARYASGKGTSKSAAAISAPTHTLEEYRDPIQVGLVVSGSYLNTPVDMTMQIIDKVQQRSPTSVAVVLSGAIPGQLVQFYIGSLLVGQVRADLSGTISAVSILIPPTPPGAHVLRAECGSMIASDSFTLVNGPTTLKDVSPDADPVEVPGALRADGNRSWVLQDLLPGGLGSYVFIRNPNEISDRPINQRRLTGRRSSSASGQHHIFEAVSNDFEWKFGGVCFTEEDQEVLYRYGDLNRRFYLIDQKNRAWVVTFSSVEIVPRLRKNLAIAGERLKLTDWMADYTVTVISHERTWRTPIPLED